MAEPLTILTIAAATAQFIDFGLKTLALCKQIRDSTTDQVQFHTELQASIKVLDDIRKGVTLDSCPRELKDTTRDCSSAAKELQDLLLEIQGIAKAKRFGALRAALRTVKDQKKIEKLQNKLERCQHRFHAAISVDTRERVLQLLKEQEKTVDTVQHVLLPELQRMQQESSRSHSTTHSKLAFLESNQQASKDAILEGQGRIRDEFSKAYCNTISKLTGLERSHRASSDAAKHDQGKTRQEMHGRFNDAKFDAEASSLHRSFMESLKYPDMFARYQSIRAPAPTTYEWIFTGDSPLHNWTDSAIIAKDREIRGGFRRWLESEGLIFWISGKAGSGKSSLISFIEDDHRTQQALKIWAGDRALHTISVFFWRAGSTLQKSFVGMLQSLLYQLCQKKPAVAASIVTNDPSTRYYIAWNETKLLRALRWALACYQDDCIFCIIDGLDEYEGQYTKLLEALFGLQHISGMKICVSSRPETAIFNRLNSYPSLRLQDLNYDDIERFVKNEFTGRGVSFGSELVQMVSSRAEGIFLWAVLVCQSLVSGHDAKDDTATLQRRLEAIPAGLQEIFRHMFSQLDENHRHNLAVYFFLLKWASSKSIEIPVALVAVLLHQQPLVSLQAFTDACCIWQDRIVAQCKGLIEIDAGWNQYSATSFKWAMRDASSGSIRRQPMKDDKYTETQDYTRSYPRWVHRSAYDCILGDSKDGPIPWLVEVDERALMDNMLAAQSWITQYTSTVFHFDPSHAKISCIEVMFDTTGLGDLSSRLRVLSKIASSTVEASPDKLYRILDELHDTMCTSFFEDHEAGVMSTALRFLFGIERPCAGEKQELLSPVELFKVVHDLPLIIFWECTSYDLDAYVVSRFERIKRNAYALLICARTINMNCPVGFLSHHPGRMMMIDLLQRGSKDGNRLAMVLPSRHDELVTWVGNERKDADATVWGIMQASENIYQDGIWSVAYRKMVDTWEIFTGNVMICDETNCSQILPLQLTLPARLTIPSTRGIKAKRSGPARSNIRALVIDFAGWPSHQLEGQDLLVSHEDCRVLVCFDLSTQSTELLLSYSKSTRELLRFSGASTDYAQCLETLMQEIRADAGAQLDPEAQLRLLDSLEEWFVRFWEISDPFAPEGSCEGGATDD